MSTHDEFAVRGRQSISEGLKAGYLRWVGERQLELTAKATAYDLVLYLTHFIDLADQARRDFTEEERQEILGQLKRVVEVLQSQQQTS